MQDDTREKVNLIRDKFEYDREENERKRLVNSPIEANHLSEDMGEHTNKERYQRLLEVFTDADWAGFVDDRRSTSGYCTFRGGNLVTWRSKKQLVIAGSSAEAEYRAMAHGVCELLWFQTLLHGLGVSIDGSMKLYCDNKTVINIAHNLVQHDRTKHIEIDRHFIKEKLSEGLICMPFVKSDNQLADIFIKGLGNKSFHPIVFKIGMMDIFTPT